MSGNGNQVPQAQTQRGAGAYPRATTPHNELNWHHIGPECYHPSGAAGGTFMTGASSAQSSAQSMRGQPAPQPSAPPAPPQDISKTTMAGPSYVASQNQTAPSRPQYQNFPYRGSQHGNRPTNHPRQQQPFIGSSGTTATGAVMYHPTLVFPPHMGIPQTYQQPRSTTPGYYQYVGPYISYTTPAGHTPPYFYSSNGQQMCGSTVGGTGRGTSGALVPQQPPAPTAPNALPHQQPQPHIHPAITGNLGIRQAPPKRTSHRLAIINPLTKQDIFSEINSSDSQYVSGDSSERQTPQPESTHSAVEEFVKRVSEVANQPSASESASKLNYVSKNVEVPVITPSSNNQPQTKAIITINSNILKSDNINDNESKTLGSEIIEINETPIVSAISDSPVVVPKMTINVKQTQKITEPTQPLFIDSKNLTNNNKENKYKPVVPQDEIEKQSDSVEFIIPQTTSEQMVVIAKCVQSSATIASPVNVSISSSTVTPVVHSQTLPAPAPVLVPMPVPLSLLPTFTPQPQRIREPRERMRSEDKDINPGPKAIAQDYTLLCNGPTTVEISSVDSLLDAINPPTSQVTENLETEIKVINQLFTTHETELSNAQNPEVVNCRESRLPVKSTPTATELLSASIEKVAKEQLLSEVSFNKEESIAILAQAKLTQSIASVARNHPEPMMKDLNNSKTSDPDTANGNSAEVNKNETEKDNVPINEKAIKNSKNSNKKTSKQTVANNEANKSELHENGKDETDNVSKEEQEQNLSQEEQSTAVEPAPGSPVFVPKYKYSDDQWSPLNKSGKKYYDIGLLMQIKDDPQSKNKPNAPLLETCNVIKSPVPEMMNFNPFLRPVNDALFPNFLKNSGSIRTNAPRDPKKDGRVITPGGKGSVKLPSSSSSSHKNVIHVSLSLREDVKLSQTKDAWRPTRFKKDNVTEEEYRTQELYKKFRGILNKLTPQKFDTLLDRVKTLEINTQARLEGVIDLIFQKAIDEPNFSEAYAAMCSKLSMLKVPANNDPEQCVNFRGLIISRCQKQFITEEVDENILKLEKELAECADSAKKRELHLMIEEENRRVRMKSVGNVRFIGELYKLKMLTSKIMVYCMTYLIEKLEEEKLECLCKLLTTIGEQVESEVKEQLESVFKKMQDIVERKSNKITSRVRFMLQDVIELKRRKWVTKNVVDSQPKMMDQIQKEAEQQQRHIELMNSTPMGGGGGSGGGGFRRDEGGRGKRGGDRRQGSNTFMDNQWKMPRAPNYTVDTSKLKAVTQKNLNNIKLAPHNSGWNYGSGTKTPAQTSSTSMISITKNMYSMLENVQADPTSLRTNKDLNPSYQHSKSIERSTFNSRGDFNNDSGSRSGSIGVSRSNSSSRNSTAPATPAPETAPATPLPQEPLPESKKKIVKTLVMDNFVNPNDEGLLADFTQAFPAHYHAAVVTEILNVALEKSVKEINAIIKALLLLVSTGTIASENFIMGMNEILEFAPDLYIDIPMLYEYLGKLIAPHIEKKHITFIQTYRFSENIIASNHGHMFLKAILRDLKDSMGQFFVKTKWQESGLELKQWMTEEQVPKWIENNRFEFLEGGNSIEDSKKILTPNETQSKLLQLMNTDENCDCIRGWVQDNLGVSSNEDWFMRALIQAICEHALYGSEGRDVPHFSHERINKYASLINDFGESRDQREASCLFGIQQLIHRLVHPQGLTLEIFQYLHEQYIISVEGFITWEDSEKEPEGKAVMLKALTSFFTNIREADNEESCSED